MSKKLSKKEKMFLKAFYAIAGIGFGIFSLFSKTTLQEKDLVVVNITLSKEPKYEQSMVKTTTYYDLYLYSKEYKFPFDINSFTYKSLDHKKVRKYLKPNEKIWVKVDKNDLDKIHNESIKVWEVGIGKESLSDNSFINKKIKKEKYLGLLILIFGIYNLIFLLFEKRIQFDYKYGTYVGYAIAILILVLM